MGKVVGLTFGKESAPKNRRNEPEIFSNPLASKYKRMKTPELDALLEERGIEAPDGTTNPQRVELLVRYDEANGETAGKTE